MTSDKDDAIRKMRAEGASYREIQVKLRVAPKTIKLALVGDAVAKGEAASPSAEATKSPPPKQEEGAAPSSTEGEEFHLDEPDPPKGKPPQRPRDDADPPEPKPEPRRGWHLEL